MNTGTILIVAFVSVGLGYAAGLILTRRSIENEKRFVHGNSESGPRYDAYTLSVSLWSKTPEGPLLADVYGRTFHKREEVGEQEKNRLMQEIRVIEAWFGIKSDQYESLKPLEPVTEEVELQSEKPDSTTVEVEIESPVVTMQSSTKEMPASPEIPPQTAGQTLQSDLPVEPVITEAQMDEIMPPPPVAPVAARLDNRTKIKNEPEPKTIVQQINDILQEKVARSALAETGVKLQETPKGVLVWVGKNSFQGIDSVPSGEAKDLIRASVKEWEKH